MKNDLKIIKKLFGEDFMHFCRQNFPTILEEGNALPNLLTTYFAPQKSLLYDLKLQEMVDDFKDFILYKFYDKKIELKDTDKSPQELLLEKDYILYECKTEEDIQSFKSYYKPSEQLCTFIGGRLEQCHVFFAVKKNASLLNREDFTNPKRQDEYGTSVISIQFSRDKAHTLSIKNRYNHTVENCDATFRNNLDNIVEGLTKSFENKYNLKQKYIQNEFDLPGYVKANDGKLYKYNYYIEKIYYCPNNIIIDSGDPIKYDKEKYIILDYFVLSLGHNPVIDIYDKYASDSFTKALKNIKKVNVSKYNDGKIISIIRDNFEDVFIKLDNLNRIIGYYNKNLKVLDHFFLEENITLSELYTPNVEFVKDYVLFLNKNMKVLDLPKVKKIGTSCFFYNEDIHTINAPMLRFINDGSFWMNRKLTNLNASPDLEIGDGVFKYCQNINGRTK